MLEQFIATNARIKDSFPYSCIRGFSENLSSTSRHIAFAGRVYAILVRGLPVSLGTWGI
jgi:hypothetical protein